MTSGAALEATRKEFVTGLNRVPEDILQWEVVPGATTIGETVLHVGGVEYLLAGSLLIASGWQPDPVLWTALKHGFARNAGFEPPSDLSSEGAIAILEQVRQLTYEAVATSGSENLAESSIRAAVAMVKATDPTADDEVYEELAKCVAAKPLRQGSGLSDLPTTIVAHESYHRGQILFQSYLASQRI